jgi:NAD(P)H dehydrogenase (quinone)
MIVVTGATGHLGRLIIAALLQKIPATDIVAAVRNGEKAKDIEAWGVNVRLADYNQPLTWHRALKGADKVLLISSSEVGHRARQHRSVIDAASEAGVRLLAYTSILRANTSPLKLAAEHRETEALILASGIPYTFLRNGWYTENYTVGIPGVLTRGVVYGCAGNGLIASAARIDYAEAAAEVLTAKNQAGRVYELAGDAAYTLADFAAEISRQSGRKISYVNLEEADYRNLLVKASFPDVIAAMIADSETGVSKGALFDDSHQMSTLISRPTTSLAASVAAVMNDV